MGGRGSCGERETGRMMSVKGRTEHQATGRDERENLALVPAGRDGRERPWVFEKEEVVVAED